MVCYPEISIDSILGTLFFGLSSVFLTLPKIILKVNDCTDTFQVSLVVFNGTEAHIRDL